MARIFETGREFSDSVKIAIGFCQVLLRKIASEKPNTSNLTELHKIAPVLNIATT